MSTMDRVCIQAPTGAGKTVVFTEITRLLNNNGYRVWIMVPRNELLKQASNTLRFAGIPHGMISAKGQESSAFNVHVVSKDTLIRRYDQIKKPPDFLIPDECHIALDRQIEIWEKLDQPRMLGFSATPERQDGRGLSELYQGMVKGPELFELVELGFLSEPKYFCPPLEGLDKVHRRGTEYVPAELQELLERRKVYGKAIEHYERHAKGLPTIAFTRSVKAAEETAHRFREAGYRYESIDGSMLTKQRKRLIDGLRNGELDGLTSCDLLTYGVDIPNVACIILLRPTLSKALHYQMIGRGLRKHDGKGACVILDHVNNYFTHGHPLAPYEWKFHGKEKRISKSTNTEAALKLCPEIDFLYCDKPSCNGCEHNSNNTTRREKQLKVVDMQLTEIKSPVKIKERPSIEKAIYVDRINDAVTRYWDGDDKGPIGELLEIATELKRAPMWVYWKLSEGRHSVNVTLLHEIARQKGYAKGWVYFKKTEISKKIKMARSA